MRRADSYFQNLIQSSHSLRSPQASKLIRLESTKSDLIKQGMECQDRILHYMGEADSLKKQLNDERRVCHDLKVEVQQTSKKEVRGERERERERECFILLVIRPLIVTAALF